MDLTSLKAWQWGTIGVVMGSIIGFSWMSMPSDVPRSADVGDFKRVVGTVSSGARYPANKDLPVIKNLVVLPPEIDPDGKQVYPVRFDRLGVNSKDETVYQAQGLYAVTPFEGNQSVVDYLHGRQVSFSDRTGPGAYRPVYMGAAVGLFTLGFLWPAFISLLVGAGLEKPKPREAKRVYASGDLDDGSIKEKKQGVSAKDLNDLNALNDRLEASVGAGLKSRDGAKADAQSVEEIVSKLMSGSGSRNTEDPTATAATAQNDEPKEYQGEWYPVVKPKVHKDEVK
jgi:hypothetical protein